MRGISLGWKLAPGIVALSCLAPATAGADVHLQFGTKWQPLRYTTAAYPSGGATGLTGLSSPIGLSGFQTTSLDPYFAIFFAQKYGLQLSLDIGYGSLGSSSQTAMNPVVANDVSFLQFGFSLGFKFYITQPRREKVSPYIYADFYKYFSSINAPNSMLNDGQVGFAASLLSPLGASFAFGAEYFVTQNFSIGSEVLGLKVASVSADLTVPAGPTRTTASYTYVTFYTGITLNYRFQVQASVQSTEEEVTDEEAPKKRKKVRTAPAVGEEETAPPPPPPPSPEAVD
jgi:hypothetical protein